MTHALTLSHHNMTPPTPGMSLPLVKSLIFHGLIVAVIVIGLPFAKKDPPDIFASAMTVELVEDATVDEQSKAAQKKPAQPPQNKSTEPPSPHKPMTQVTAKKPPKPVAPEKPAPVEQVAMPADEPEDKEPVKELEKPKPPSAKPLKKPVREVEKQPEEEQEQFRSLLRNLMPEEAQPQEKAEEDSKATPEDSPLSRFAQKMTIGEQQALQRQLSQCWNLLAGARYAEDLVVDIRLYMNPDRTIRDAQVVNKLRYTGDKFFRAAADAAMRAVFNPRCNPLDLPADKYQEWKTIVVTFDPRQVL